MTWYNPPMGSSTTFDESFVDSLLASSPSMDLLRELVGRAAPTLTAGAPEPEEEDLSGRMVGAPITGMTGRFVLERRLGSGGFGSVYAAYDHARETRVALKILARTGGRDVFLFKQEFRSLADLDHPNLVTLYELERDPQDIWFFTMELVEGVPFDRWVRPPPDARLDEARLQSAFSQLVAALHYLHSQGRVHRDVKPANVLVSKEGRVVLLDFGLAAAPESVGTGLVPGHGAGTKHYLAPENMTGGPLGPPADWYAVGVMLHTALLGHRPNPETGPELAALSGDGLPRDIADLTRQLLAIDPEDRPSGQELLGEVGTLERVTRLADPGFVGRRTEVDRLVRAYLNAAAGRPTLAVVHGLAGIGKSALLDHLVTRLEGIAPTPLVLRGRCFAEESLPYRALDTAMDQLASWLVSLPAEVRLGLVPLHAPALVRVFPSLGAGLSVPPAPGDAELGERVGADVAAAFEGLLGRVAAARPVVLVVDDAQWGDEESAALLRDLLAGGELPVLIVLAVRPSHKAVQLQTLAWFKTAAKSALPRWFTQLLAAVVKSERTQLVQLELLPLEPRDLIELAGALLPDDPERARLVATSAMGIPRFAHELASYAAAGGEVRGADGTVMDIDTLIEARIDALSESARQLLTTLALAGQPIERAVAARAARIEREPAIVAELKDARLVAVSGIGARGLLEPKHDRIRRVASARVPREGWAPRLAALAEALQESGRADPETLCGLYLRAKRPQDGLSHLLAAIDWALESGALARAERLMGAAREMLGADHALLAQVAQRERLLARLRGQEPAREAPSRKLPRALKKRAEGLAKRALPGPEAPRGGGRARRHAHALDTWLDDPGVGAWQALDALEQALDVDDADAFSVRLAPAWGAAHLARYLGRASSRASDALEQALDAWTRRYPELSGQRSVARAAVALLEGRWAHAGRHAAAAEARLSERSGEQAQRDLARLLRVWARYLGGGEGLMGELPAGAERGSSARIRSLARVHTAWMRALLADRPEAAAKRLEADTDAGALPAVVRLLATTDVALYRCAGKGETPLAAFERTEATLTYPGVVPTLDALLMGAKLRAQLAANSHASSVKASLKGLRGCASPIAEAFALMARARLAAPRWSEVQKLLGEAREAFASAGMALHEAALGFRLSGGEDSGATAALTRMGCARPKRWADTIVPAAWLST